MHSHCLLQLIELTLLLRTPVWWGRWLHLLALLQLFASKVGLLASERRQALAKATDAREQL